MALELQRSNEKKPHEPGGVWLYIFTAALNSPGVNRNTALEVADASLKEYEKRFINGK